MIRMIFFLAYASVLGCTHSPSRSRSTNQRGSLLLTSFFISIGSTYMIQQLPEQLDWMDVHRRFLIVSICSAASIEKHAD